MIRAFTLGLILSVCAVKTAHADPLGLAVAPDIILERVETLSVQDWWALGRSDVVERNGMFVSLSQFDWESAPINAGWAAVGLVGVGQGDLGEIPVVLRVWSRHAQEQADFAALHTAAEQPGHPMAVTLLPDHPAVQIEIEGSNRVLVNGVFVGAISH